MKWVDFEVKRSKVKGHSKTTYGQRSSLGSIFSPVTECMNMLQWNVSQLLRDTDDIFKVVGLKVKVTDNVVQKCTFPPAAYRYTMRSQILFSFSCCICCCKCCWLEVNILVVRVPKFHSAVFSIDVYKGFFCKFYLTFCYNCGCAVDSQTVPGGRRFRL